MKRKITDVALLFVLVILPTALTRAQAPAVGDEAATLRLPNPQLEFVGQETYEVNGGKGTRYKLSVTNRASHPDFLWRPTRQLAPCGKNEYASRTWVEIFGSPGDRRLSGFCDLRSSEDLGHLWFPVPSGEKGPPCVYIVMTDRRNGKKYTSNRVCSRLFTVVTGSLKAGGKQEAGGFGWDRIAAYGPGNAAPDSRKPNGRIDVADTKAVAPRAWDPKKKTAVAGPTETRQEQASPGDPDRPLILGRIPNNKGNGSTAPGGFGNDQITSHGAFNNSTSGTPTNQRPRAAQPDLVIKQFLFPPTNDKALRVQVSNDGSAASGACRLIIVVRKINGTAVGRQTHVNIPALAPGKKVWLVIDAKSILPNNVALQSTTFKLNADGTEIVVESDETNNEVWHNL